MKSIVEVSPFRCRVWELHDRLQEHITEENCRAEIKSFQDHGQLLPVLGRRVDGDFNCDVELIYGARRLFVARLINKPLLVELRDMTDEQAIVAMDLENRQRRDVSPYERGRSYARWLRAGHFASQEDLAQVLRVSPSQVSRLIKVASLPSVIVDAFGSATEIREGWGVELAEVLQDPKRRPRAIHEARSIINSAASSRPPAPDVFRKLLSSSIPGRKPKVAYHDNVIKDVAGSPLFRVRHQRNSISIVLPLEKVSATMLRVIEQSVADILSPRPGVDAAADSVTDLNALAAVAACNRATN
jgi:ParB family chromosome partitioning protein